MTATQAKQKMAAALQELMARDEDLKEVLDSPPHPEVADTHLAVNIPARRPATMLPGAASGSNAREWTKAEKAQIRKAATNDAENDLLNKHYPGTSWAQYTQCRDKAGQYPRAILAYHQYQDWLNQGEVCPPQVPPLGFWQADMGRVDESLSAIDRHQAQSPNEYLRRHRDSLTETPSHRDFEDTVARRYSGDGTVPPCEDGPRGPRRAYSHVRTLLPGDTANTDTFKMRLRNSGELGEVSGSTHPDSQATLEDENADHRQDEAGAVLFSAQEAPPRSQGARNGAVENLAETGDTLSSRPKRKRTQTEKAKSAPEASQDYSMPRPKQQRRVLSRTVSESDVTQLRHAAATPATIRCCCEEDNDRMVACDGESCVQENAWFHYECVGLAGPPAEEKWYCDSCNVPSYLPRRAGPRLILHAGKPTR